MTTTAMPDPQIATGVHCDEHADGALTLRGTSASVRVPADGRASVAAALLPLPPVEYTVPTVEGGRVDVDVFESAFLGPVLTLRAVGSERPVLDAAQAELLAALLLDRARHLRQMVAHIERAQDHSAPADRADLEA